MPTQSILHLSPLMILLPLIAIMLSYNSLLMMLLLLETITLGMMIMYSMTHAIYMPAEPLNLLIILSFSACEASLGLACLTSMTRNRGNDYLKTTTIHI